MRKIVLAVVLCVVAAGIAGVSAATPAHQTQAEECEIVDWYQNLSAWISGLWDRNLPEGMSTTGGNADSPSADAPSEAGEDPRAGGGPPGGQASSEQGGGGTPEVGPVAEPIG